MLPSNERAYYSSGAVKEAEAVKRGAIGTISFTSPDDPRFRWDVSVATGKQGGYAWVDAAGEPQPRGSGPARIGVAQSFRRGGALCRCAEAGGRGLCGGREEHAAGVRPGHPRVDRHAVDPQGRRERQPRRAPRGQRPGAQERTRRLHRARGSLRARRGDERRRDLQRRPRQRLGRRDRARCRARLCGPAHAAPPLRPVPVRDGRGARAARLRLLRAPSDRGEGRDRRRSHARHAVPVPPAARHRAVRRAAFDARGAGDARRPAPRARDRHRSDSRAGAVHPQRPLQLRAPGRAVALHQERIQDRGSGAGWRGDQRGLPPRRLPQAQRRHVAAVRLRCGRETRAAQLPDRLARGAGDAPGRHGIRATSSAGCSAGPRPRAPGRRRRGTESSIGGEAARHRTHARRATDGGRPERRNQARS